MQDHQAPQLAAQVFVAPQAEQSGTADKVAIKGTIALYFTALNHGDVEAALALYTEDPVLLPFFMPTVVGRKDVRESYENTARTMRFQVHTTIEELVQMSPEWAYVRTESAGVVTTLKTGQADPSGFHELFLLRKGPEGAWRIARYSFSPTTPPPAP